MVKKTALNGETPVDAGRIRLQWLGKDREVRTPALAGTEVLRETDGAHLWPPGSLAARLFALGAEDLSKKDRRRLPSGRRGTREGQGAQLAVFTFAPVRR